MGQPTIAVTVNLSAADLADLEDWARNSARSVEDLLEEALQQYLRHTRDDIADLDRRLAGPEYEHEEAMRILAERRRQRRAQAAE